MGRIQRQNTTTFNQKYTVKKPKKRDRQGKNNGNLNYAIAYVLLK